MTGVATAGAVVIAGLLALTPAAQAVDRSACPNSAVALNKALSEYLKPDYAAARKSFECLIEHGADDHRLYALFYLARIFADNNGTETNHGRAYVLFKIIADTYVNTTDADDLRRAPFVARSITAVGSYVLRGDTEAAILPNSTRAVELFRTAANLFDEPDAQFELAKLMLVGDGLPPDPQFALHYLGELTKRSHAGAQAFLADLLSRGKYIKMNAAEALALSRLAVKNAQPSDRLWIEDIYQKIYCGAADGVRVQSNGLVARWSREFSRAPNQVNPRNPTPNLQPDRRLEPERTCSNGETVDMTTLVPLEQPKVAPQRGEAGNPDITAGTRPVGMRPSTPDNR